MPLYVKNDFGNFYKAMFDRAVARENMRAVFVEYAWDMGWCDPCAADPLSNKELVELGARWIGSDDDSRSARRGMQGANAYVTRLHVRYDAKTFPEDLALHGDERPLELPGPLRAAPSLDGQAELRGRRAAIAPRCRRASSRRPTTSPSLTGWEPRRDPGQDGGERAAYPRK